MVEGSPRVAPSLLETSAVVTGVSTDEVSQFRDGSTGEHPAEEEKESIGAALRVKGDTGADESKEAGFVSIDVGHGGLENSFCGEGAGHADIVCRICYLSPDRKGGDDLELIKLGCGCKDELGTAHRHCAEAWFRLKGNRCCEICGTNAKNITALHSSSTFTQQLPDRMRIPRSSGWRNSHERHRCWSGQPFCNFLMGCLVIAFVLPWFFHVRMF